MSDHGERGEVNEEKEQGRVDQSWRARGCRNCRRYKSAVESYKRNRVRGVNYFRKS